MKPHSWIRAKLFLRQARWGFAAVYLKKTVTRSGICILSGVVDDLVGDGEPVVVDNAKQDSTLLDAGIVHARTVVVATNNFETALLVTKKAREKNAKAHIIVRCYMDDFAEILETLGANEVISSSKSAFEGIAPRLGAK
jgi:voltage-gated potassium channel Kch